VKIVNIETYPVELTVKPEFFIVSSAGAHAKSRYLIVALRCDDGTVGWGEATVVSRWSGETRAGAKEIIERDIAPVVIGRDPLDFESIARDISSAVIDNPFTKAAVETAVLDLAGKALKQPVYDLLGGAKNPLQIPVKFVIGLRPPEESARIAAAKVKEGFTAIKLKVGPDPEQDFQRVRQVREAIGNGVKLNVDTNGGWTVEQAIKEIARYEPYKLEYIEQPVARHDIEGLAKVRSSVGVPIMADESVFSIWQAEEVLRRKAADLISIYPGKNGGLLQAKKICELAEKEGVACHLGSNLEWDIGTAAMCHLAVACKNVALEKFPVDILGPLYYSFKLPRTPVEYQNGRVQTPQGWGLGLDIAEKDLAAIAARDAL